MKRTKFLLLLGPSGCGKTTIIHELRKKDQRFVYISPYITRPLRDGEQDKISISDKEMDQMREAGEFLVINHIYGIRYATPKPPILHAFQKKQMPVLDWPADRMDVMTTVFGPHELYVVYISPPSIQELQRRLAKDGRDTEGKRLSAGIRELGLYHTGAYNDFIDYTAVSTQDTIPQIAELIYQNYLDSCG